MNIKDSFYSKFSLEIIATITLLTLVFIFIQPGFTETFQQRDKVTFQRGPYNLAFFYRHNKSFRRSAAIHLAHGGQHDILQLTPIKNNVSVDTKTDERWVKALKKPPRIEPVMELYGPWTALIEWDLYRAIDWTHMHHEQTYDIMSSRKIPWDKKKEWTDRSVKYYLTKLDIPRSPAPLDITMRRAGVMIKPYFTYFRNYYPQSNNFFYYAHWWHPAIYEAQMIAGNDKEQDISVIQTDNLTQQVLKDRPLRMLLSREVMPRYSRLSPESANIFDNLHMLHGIAYDILAYEGWTDEEKQKELERVIKAMSYQPGDEKLARKFNIDHPDMDPRVYYDWMKGTQGDMNRIMMEMMEEMMPIMMQEDISHEMHEKMMAQMRLKLTPGIQEGECPGSLLDAMKAIMPMRMDPESMKAGVTPQEMVNVMLAGWQQKYGSMPDVAPISMDIDPVLPPCPVK